MIQAKCQLNLKKLYSVIFGIKSTIYFTAHANANWRPYANANANANANDYANTNQNANANQNGNNFNRFFDSGQESVNFFT